METGKKETPLIELNEIYKIYQMGDQEVKANDGISLTINKGEFVAIVGKSGSGKSTLMNIIGALDVPTKGTYYLGGQDVSDMSDDELRHMYLERNRMEPVGDAVVPSFMKGARAGEELRADHERVDRKQDGECAASGESAALDAKEGSDDE